MSLLVEVDAGYVIRMLMPNRPGLDPTLRRITEDRDARCPHRALAGMLGEGYEIAVAI